MDDVAILDDVFLALDPKLPGLPAAGLALELEEVADGDDLGADEAARDVAVDLPRRDLRPVAPPDRPGAHLVLTRGEKAHQIHEGVGRPQKAVAGGFRQAEILLEGSSVALLERRELHLELSGDRHRGEARRREPLRDLGPHAADEPMLGEVTV